MATSQFPIHVDCGGKSNDSLSRSDTLLVAHEKTLQRQAEKWTLASDAFDLWQRDVYLLWHAHLLLLHFAPDAKGVWRERLTPLRNTIGMIGLSMMPSLSLEAVVGLALQGWSEAFIELDKRLSNWQTLAEGTRRAGELAVASVSLIAPDHMAQPSFTDFAIESGLQTRQMWLLTELQLQSTITEVVLREIEDIAGSNRENAPNGSRSDWRTRQRLGKRMIRTLNEVHAQGRPSHTGG